MVISQENKCSFFKIQIALEQNLVSLEKRSENALENEIDVILGRMNASSQVYKFESQDKSRIIYLFSTLTRKRRGQLEKLLATSETVNKLVYRYKTEALLKSEFTAQIKIHTSKLTTKDKPQKFGGYMGNDLKILNDFNNFYPWQKQVWNMLFYTNSSEFRPSDSREIIHLVDREGCTGKSKFAKKIFFDQPDEVGVITYGTTSQINSSIVNLGPKKLYIIDLTRAKCRTDSEPALIAALESCKNGLVSKMMYGEGSALLMEPPHILIMSNSDLDKSLLSKDRWKVFEIENKNLREVELEENENILVK